MAILVICGYKKFLHSNMHVFDNLKPINRTTGELMRFVISKSCDVIGH